MICIVSKGVLVLENFKISFRNALGEARNGISIVSFSVGEGDELNDTKQVFETG